MDPKEQKVLLNVLSCSEKKFVFSFKYGFPFPILKLPNVMYAIDYLHNACLQVSTTPEHRCFLRFTFQGQVVQSPFTFSLAPRFFSICMQVALSALMARGIRILPYSDNWFLCAPNNKQIIWDVQLRCSHYGLVVSSDKNRLALCN